MVSYIQLWGKLYTDSRGIVKSELWQACELLVLKSERELFRKRKIRAPSFSISESELRGLFY